MQTAKLLNTKGGQYHELWRMVMWKVAKRLCALSILLLPSCSIANDEAYLSGPIDKANIQKLRVTLEKGHVRSLRITSPGGPALDVLQLAELISSNRLTLKIDSYCMSSCAELIFLTDTKIVMVNEPLLGFHGNAFSYYMLLKAAKNDEDAECYFKNITSKFIPHLKIKKSEFDKFNLELLEKKRIKQVFKNYDEKGNPILYANCATYTIGSRNKFWFPTSSYLSGKLGLKFSGSVAADNPSLARQKIDANWLGGSNNVVGNVEISVTK